MFTINMIWFQQLQNGVAVTCRLMILKEQGLPEIVKSRWLHLLGPRKLLSPPSPLPYVCGACSDVIKFYNIARAAPWYPNPICGSKYKCALCGGDFSYNLNHRCYKNHTWQILMRDHLKTKSASKHTQIIILSNYQSLPLGKRQLISPLPEGGGGLLSFVHVSCSRSLSAC